MVQAKKKAKKQARKSFADSVSQVGCWEDDPGDASQQPALAPIQVDVPDQGLAPFAFKLAGRAPAPAMYAPGTNEFLYYAAACALRRTANFWVAVVPDGTVWEVGATLPVDQDSGEDLNAFYTRGDGGEAPGLHFVHEMVNGRTYFSGESPDVVCHEMGHAVLDSLRPELFDAQTIEAAAFHESFADMSAILSALQVASFRDQLLKDVGTTLNRTSRLTRLAEQLGSAIRVQHPDAVDPDCLRNAANSFFYLDPQTLPPSAPASQLSSEPHSFSRVFTAAFMDALAGIFKLQDPTTQGLLQSSQDMANLLVGGILAAAVVPDYYSQVAANMVQFGESAPFSGKYRDVLKSAFVRRGILSLQAAVTLGSMKAAVASRGVTKRSPAKNAPLPLSSISAAQYGLSSSSLKVYLAAQPKRYSLTAASSVLGPIEPRSAQNAAESYTEDLFQRGRVNVGEHGHPEAGFENASSFKTHMIAEDNGELMLKRVAFECGFDRNRNT